MNLLVTHAWRKSNLKSVFRINCTEMLINFIVLFYQSIMYNQTRNTVRDGLQWRKTKTLRVNDRILK